MYFLFKDQLQPDWINESINVEQSITLGESLLAILTFVVRHKRSKAALQDLLGLLRVHLGTTSLPQTNYLLG